MKKSDLKTGMIVECNNGDRHIVLLDADDAERNLIDIDKGGWVPLNDYDKDLKHRKYDEWSIKKVYSVGIYIASIFRNKDWAMKHAKVIWEREGKPVEMTVAEIEEKLGIKNLKIVKE